MKTWKTLQRLAAATERFLKGIDFPKMLRNLENTCYRKYLLILVLVKLQTLCLDLWLKMNPITAIVQVIFLHLRNPCSSIPPRKM